MKVQIAVIFVLFVALQIQCNGFLSHHKLETWSKKFPAAKETRNAIDDAIIALLEQWREQLPVGFPELGIPPLDPLFVEHYVLELDHRLIQLYLTLDNATITNLSSFQIDKIENDLTNLKADFGVTIPELDINGKYIAEGEIPSFVHITGNGSASLVLTGLSTWGTVTIGSEGNSPDGNVFVSSLEIDFSLEALKTDLENFMGGGAVGDLMNDLISENGPAYLEQLKPEINEYIASLVLSLANPILGQYTLQEILDYLGVNPN